MTWKELIDYYVQKNKEWERLVRVTDAEVVTTETAEKYEQSSKQESLYVDANRRNIR